MPFVTSTGLTEEETSSTIEADGVPIHYHDIGSGEPILFLHVYGPGATAWLTWHKVVDAISKQYRCILLDLVNAGKTGPMVMNEGSHEVHARHGTQLLDALGLEGAFWIGHSTGGESALAAAIRYPQRVRKFVLGGNHISGGVDRNLMTNNPTEGSRAAREVFANPTKDNIRRWLLVHINDGQLVTDELVDYMHHWHTYSPQYTEARAKSSMPRIDYRPDLGQIKAPALLVHGRDDRMVPFELSIDMLNRIENSRMLLLNNSGHWPPFENPMEYAEHVLTFLRMDL